MKKILFITFMLIAPLILMGCSNNLSVRLQDNLSEVRFNLFTASNEKINVNFTSGFREDPYVINGISENKKEFGVITVKFLCDISTKEGTPKFVITINEMDFDNEFILNPFDQTYVQDISTFVLDDSTIFIKITWQDFYFESELVNESNNFNINHKQALNIFIKEFETDITNLLKGDINFEMYVKIISDPSLNIDQNYFYVSLISVNGNSFSVIIDPNSGQILAKNQSLNNKFF